MLGIFGVIDAKDKEPPLELAWLIFPRYLDMVMM